MDRRANGRYSSGEKRLSSFAIQPHRPTNPAQSLDGMNRISLALVTLLGEDTGLSLTTREAS